MRSISQCPNRALCSERILTLLYFITTPMCECGGEKETVDHYPLSCESYNQESDALRMRVGVQVMNISTLRQ